MSRISVFESSENGRVVTEYGKLPLRELEKRISFYEKKYGTNFARHYRQFDCDSASPWETSDLMDWQNLVDEKKERTRKPRVRVASRKSERGGLTSGRRFERS